MRTDLTLADDGRGTIGSLEFAIPVWATATALVLVLIVAWLFGSIAKWLLRRRARLNTTTCMVLSILGTAVGLFIAGAVDHRLDLWSLVTVVLGLVSSIVAVAAYGTVAARLQSPPDITIAELLSSGESERVEFKSTARVNLRNKQKDLQMEQVIAKTVSAFLNSEGGTLRSPDADRFELWLRDMLTATLGQSTAAAVGITIEPVKAAGADEAGGADTADVLVCRIECAPSPRPVYLRGPKNNAQPEFWVRAGNSTRQLSVDQAAEYVMHRWPLGAGRAVAAQIRAAARFSAS
ncbi:AlbA family DNA-binding domain-containing protein [Gordonia jinghuaiqii]|uniref:AlbA family DNA-binding domain-containing protein n=1 Tax=Gordonia jinghuaiqii TaxID=2758710 RepID=UPI002948BD82|nr:ATP-binding protein [Gordonia jinghuaiqii]